MDYLEGRYKGSRDKPSTMAHITRDNGPLVQLGVLRLDTQVTFLSQEVVYP